LINILKLLFEGLGAFGALLDSISHLTQEVAPDSCGTPPKHELTVPTLDLKVPPCFLRFLEDGDLGPLESFLLPHSKGRPARL
jgi:hypothetical protein